MELLRAILAAEVRGPLPEGLSAKTHDGFTAVFARAERIPRLFRRRKDHLRVAERHVKDLEGLMAFGTVIPAMADTRLAPENGPQLIRANRPLLDRLAERFRGTVQYQLRIDWEESRVLGKFQDNAEIAPLFSSSTVSAAAVSQAVERLANRLRARIDTALAPLSCETLRLPLADGGLYNAALILPAGREDALDAVLAEIDAIWSDGFIIRLIGPAPPMSFASLKLRHAAPSDLERAEVCLGLPATWGTDELAAARNKVLKSLGDTRDGAEEIRQAEALLLAWDRAGWPPKGVPVLSTWTDQTAQRDDREEEALAWAG